MVKNSLGANLEMGPYISFIICSIKLEVDFPIVQTTFQIHLSKGQRLMQIVCQLNEKEKKVMIFMSWKLWELLVSWASWNLKIFHALGLHYVTCRSVFPCSRLSFSVGTCMLLNKSGTGAKIFMHLFLFNYIDTVTATTVLSSCVKGLTSASSPSFKSSVPLTVSLFLVLVDLLPLQWIQREY